MGSDNLFVRRKNERKKEKKIFPNKNQVIGL